MKSDRQREHAIIGSSHRGPIFGRGYDLVIEDKCNENTSYTFRNEPHVSYEWTDYNLPGGLRSSDHGHYHFTVIDYYMIKIQ